MFVLSKVNFWYSLLLKHKKLVHKCPLTFSRVLMPLISKIYHFLWDTPSCFVSLLTRGCPCMSYKLLSWLSKQTAFKNCTLQCTHLKYTAIWEEEGCERLHIELEQAWLASQTEVATPPFTSLYKALFA